MVSMEASTLSPLADNISALFSSGGEDGNLTGAFITTITTTTSKQEEFLDPRVLAKLIATFYFGLQIPVLAFGLVSNVLNIIFKTSGQRDSASIALMALSISDLTYNLVYLVCRILMMMEPRLLVLSKLHLGFLAIMGRKLRLVGYVFQDTSAVITVFVAVQKCCCVAIPHLFKNVFTPKRTLIIILCATPSIALTHVSLLSGVDFEILNSPLGSNKTILSLLRTPQFYRGRAFWMSFNRIIFPVSNQIVSVICLIIMAVHLGKSAKFRSASAEVHKADTKSSSSESRKAPSAKMGSKERRAVMCLAVVTGLFVATTFLSSIWVFLKLLFPKLFRQPRFYKFNNLINSAQSIPVNVSASVNIFVYLKYNTKFKQTAVSLFKRWFRCDGQDTDVVKNTTSS